MCLTVRGNIKIAKKDRVVYKTFFECGGKLLSPFMNKRYLLNKTYRRKDITIVTPDPIYNINKKEINEGYHAYTTLYIAERKCMFDNKSVYRAIIPAGSQYAISDDNEIVSNQIIIKNKVLRLSKAVIFPPRYKCLHK